MCFLEANAVLLLNLYSSVMLMPKRREYLIFFKKKTQKNKQTDHKLCFLWSDPHKCPGLSSVLSIE